MTAVPRPAAHILLTPAEVAEMFRVDPKTVTRWAKNGRIPQSEIVWTLGGHRRYKADFMRGALNGTGGTS